jgi:hypothetical protein
MENDSQTNDAIVKDTSRKTTCHCIAPCGMNCSLCRAYGRAQKPCPGCRGDDGVKTKTRLACRIKNCEKLLEGGIGGCFDCSDFPCKALCHLDSRYRTRYGMSVIENLASISRLGIPEFVEKENQRWRCRQCGETLCVHKSECPSCGQVWLGDHPGPTRQDDTSD